MSHRLFRGFTLVELLVVMAIIAILIALLLPYFEQAPLWRKIKGSPGQGGDPASATFPHPSSNIPLLLCPSDSLPPRDPSGSAQRSYAFCTGDAAVSFVNVTPIQNDTRGAFGWRACRNFRDFTDGTSTTILMAERAVGYLPSRDQRGLMATLTNAAFTPASCRAAVSSGRSLSIHPLAGTPINLGSPAMGQLWASGEPEQNSFSTVLPPNGPSCDFQTTIMGSLVTARTTTASCLHANGVQVLLGDGAVRFISENINCGDVTFDVTYPSGKSPYGVWGALGTVFGKETIGEF